MTAADSQTDQAPEPPSGNGARSTVIANSILLCLFAIVGTDTLIATLVYVNTWVGAQFPWFIAPALALSLGVLRRSRRWYEPLTVVRPPSTAVSVLISVLTGVAVAAVSLVSMALTSSDALTHGRIALSGDQYHTTAAVRAGVSLTAPVMGAFYEEAGIRAALQLRLQHSLGPRMAEILAGALFVVMHGLRITRAPWLLPILALSAFANGRIAAVTQSVRYPVLSHALANGIVTVTSVILRGMNI